MDIQSAVLNELFVLYPVIIPGWISPVRPVGIAAGGIPKSLYDGQPTGLECLVDPWTEVRSLTLAVDDSVYLYVNDGATPVASKTINPGEENRRIRLYVRHGEFQEGVNTLHYVVKNPSGNGSEKSRVLEVLYHLRAPGEPAPAGIRLQIPTVVRDQGVDAEQAAQGVVFGFDYTNRRAYDRIRLTLGTVPVDREVDPGEVGPGLPVITQTLFTDTFRKSGENPNTLVFYSVVDQLGNRNQSVDVPIDVHLDHVPSLQPPSVKEASGNNLNPVAAQDRLTAVLPADLRSTDLVSVTWTGPAGAPADGTYISLPRPISETGYEIPLPTSVIPFCLGKQATLTYNVTRGDTPIPSPSFPVNVQTLPLSELRMPMLKEASNNGEGPDLLLHQLTAQGQMWFPGFAFITVDQPVWLRLKGTRSNGDVYDNLLWQPPGAFINQGWVDKGFFEYAAPYADLKDLKDGTPLTMELKVGLGRSTNEAEAVSFQMRSYTVKAALDLEAPTVVQATVVVPGESATLNPLDVLRPPFFTIRVQYSPMLNSDEIKVFFDGKPGLGTPTIPADKGNASVGFVDFIVANQTIAANLSKPCIVRYEVARAGATTPSKNLQLAVQALPSSVLNLVSVPEATDGVIDARGDNRVLALHYAFMQPGQPFWIDLISRQDCNLRDGVAVSAAEFNAGQVVELIPKSYLLALSDGEKLDVEARVSLDGTGKKDLAVSFLIPQYRVKKGVSIIGDIAVAQNPREMVISPDGKRIYVVHISPFVGISVINTDTNKVIHTFPVAFYAYSLAIHPNGSRLYVSGQGTPHWDHNVYVFETTSYAHVQTIKMIETSNGVTLNSSGSHLYSSSEHNKFLYVYDTSSGQRMASIPAVGPAFSTMNPAKTRLYASGTNAVYVINVADNSVVSTIPVASSFSWAIAYSPHHSMGQRIYTTKPSLGTVTIIDAGINTVAKTLSGFSQPCGVAFNPVIERAYVAQSGSNELAIVNTATEEIIENIPGFKGPRGVVVTHDGAFAYVANESGSSISVVAL
ncbi:hypothetical protein PS943_04141 [Pseudomonas fluorescens]|uniref:YncE family protein n=1 Tax=Pseudomonas fluorescens TaxID=294 RepID=A0A5E7WJB7_PSEFL|nr:YncE family protein [Pseudomonas fluorescens]VVQ35152.1 hypothetical protein PS943_04141 [Pseudomonas fluorescens]